MKFTLPVVEGILIKRYKRFLADVQLPDKKIIVAHVPNSGSMMGVSDPGSRCLLTVSDSPTRKLPHTLEMIETKEGQWVGVNTSLTNKLVKEAFDLKKITDWHSFDEIIPEVKINAQSRLDFLLTSGKKLTSRHLNKYVEVKNVSMAYPPLAVFPDAPTERGQKHLRELAALVEKGHQAEIFFVVQRQDCHTFRPCDEIDPAYGKLLREMGGKNVLIRAWSCKMSPLGVELASPLKVDLT